MKKGILSIIVILSGSIYIFSCGKTKNNGPAGGGKGGELNLQVVPVHHGQVVDSCVVYIKYATNQAPSNGIYDDSTKALLSDTTPIAAFIGLLPGQYYIFGKGIHPTYSPPNVQGGLPITLDKSEQVYLPTYQY